MLLTMLKSKIHRATVTQANLNYVGSITIDEDLMDASGLLEYEKVQIADVTSGVRLETYVIKGKRGSGIICLNGAAARLVKRGDKIIVMAYVRLTPKEAKKFMPRVIFVDGRNKIISLENAEKHGKAV
jgi:aspartate 1-decarboxylase